MSELWFDAEADATLRHLEADPSRAALARAVQLVLDQLERDSGARAVRRIRFQVPALWCVTVIASGEKWAVLWEPHPDIEGVVIIHYIGPASFS